MLVRYLSHRVKQSISSMMPWLSVTTVSRYGLILWSTVRWTLQLCPIHHQPLWLLSIMMVSPLPVGRFDVEATTFGMHVFIGNVFACGACITTSQPKTFANQSKTTFHEEKVWCMQSAG